MVSVLAFQEAADADLGLGRAGRAGRAGPRLDGVWLTEAPNGPVDVLLGAQRIWSFNPHRDARKDGDLWQVPWPAPLQRFLDGVGHFTVREHNGGRLFFDGEVRLGAGQAPIRIADAAGHPHAYAGRRAEPGGSHGLVGTLTAGSEGRRAAEHGRPGPGQGRHRDRDVHVEAAEDRQPCIETHDRTVLLRHSRGQVSQVCAGTMAAGPSVLASQSTLRRH